MDENKTRMAERFAMEYFANFKAAHSFTTLEEAEAAMVAFLAKMKTDEEANASGFARVMIEQCEEALNEAKKVAFPAEIGEMETCEWHIDPAGVALEHRMYYHDSVDYHFLLSTPDYVFSEDYEVKQVLGCSKDRDIIGLNAFASAFGVSVEDVFSVLAHFPCQAYTIDDNDNVRISEGAYELIKTTQCFFWPCMAATPNATVTLASA